MKKTYINPEMEVVKLKMSQVLLDGSLTKDSETVISSNDAVLGRGFDGFDDDDE